MTAKLGNEAFTAKAPADVIEKSRARLATAEADIARLESRLAALLSPGAIPYPPMSALAGLIAKTAIVSGPPARTRNPGLAQPPERPHGWQQ